MAAKRKARRSKSSSSNRSSTPSSTSSSPTPTSSKTTAATSFSSSSSSYSPNTSTSTVVVVDNPHKKQKHYQQEQCIKVPDNDNANDDTNSNSNNGTKNEKNPPLVLTSSKKARNGMVECDYCHTDISQVPRITCAICIDFDICLECFTQVSHDLKHVNTSNYNKILKGELLLSDAGVDVSSSSIDIRGRRSTGGGGGGVGDDALVGAGGGGGGGGELVFDETTILPLRTEQQKQPVEKKQQHHEQQHDSSHGYRVADSTRYFLFPSLRGVTVEESANQSDGVKDQSTNNDAVTNENTSTIGGDASDAGGGGGSETCSDTKENKDNIKNDENNKDQSVEGGENNEPQKKRTKVMSSEKAGGDNKEGKESKITLENDSNDKMDIDCGGMGDETQKIASITPSGDTTCTNPTNTAAIAASTFATEDESAAALTSERVAHNEDNKEITKTPGPVSTGPPDENESNDISINDAPCVGKDEKNDAKNRIIEDTVAEKEEGVKREDETNMEVQKSVDNNVQMNDVSNHEQTKTASMSKPMATDNVETTKEKEENKPQEDTILEKKDVTSIPTTIPKDRILVAEKVDSIDNSIPEKKTKQSNTYIVNDDPRYMWTIEEDLRLLEAISTFGLGNWADISEELCSFSSTNKTPKRCMERYIDDFCGRYGHILPEYTLVQVQDDDKSNDPGMLDAQKSKDEFVNNTRKRLRSGNTSNDEHQHVSTFKSNGKEYRIIKTSSLSDYDKIWPEPYVPPLPDVKAGDDVGRDHAVRCEQTYVKELSSACNSQEAKSIEERWRKSLNKAGGPTVLPPRADDVKKLPGAELAGFMPRRGDFDVEWENDSDRLLEDMEFSPNDTPEEREIKIRVIEIYNSKLDEREKRKKFLVDHELLDYRKKQREDRKLPPDERDLVNRMRLFARFHTAEEHKKLIDELLKAKRLRKEIARLQMYHRMGFNSLLDVERFELDRNRKESHRLACRQKEKEQEQEQQAAAKAAGDLVTSGASMAGDEKETYHRQYKSSDRKIRRSINRRDIKDDVTKAGVSNAPPKNDTDHASDVKPETEIMSSSTKQTKDLGGETEVVKKKDSPTCEKFDVKKCESVELLSSKEMGLCQRLELKPKLYLKAKRALIEESLKKNILDDETKSSHRSVMKIDVKCKGDIVKFVLQAGWIPPAPNVDDK